MEIIEIAETFVKSVGNTILNKLNDGLTENLNFFKRIFRY